VTDGTELLAQVGDQRILLSVVISAVLVAFVWRVDLLLVRYTRVSEDTVEDLRGFRGVATGTMVVVTLAWIVGQPTPEWLAAPFEAIAGPQFVEGLVAFLPPFAVNRPRPLSRFSRRLLSTGRDRCWLRKIRGESLALQSGDEADVTYHFPRDRGPL